MRVCVMLVETPGSRKLLPEAIRARTAAFAVCPLRDVVPFPSALPSSALAACQSHCEYEHGQFHANAGLVLATSRRFRVHPAHVEGTTIPYRRSLQCRSWRCSSQTHFELNTQHVVDDFRNVTKFHVLSGRAFKDYSGPSDVRASTVVADCASAIPTRGTPRNMHGG